MARKQRLQEPQVRADGSIPYVPLPDHKDPDFDNFIYGDSFGRLQHFNKGDIAGFIESGTANDGNWGYYLVAFFIIEASYAKTRGLWKVQVS